MREKASRAIIRKAFNVTQALYGLRVISDNPEPPTVDYLRQKGVQIISIKETPFDDAPDDFIREIADEHDAIILTHDRDFERRPPATAGAVILPQNPNGPSSPNEYPVLQAALEHLIHEMPATNPEWRDVVIRYTESGHYIDLSIPPRPCRNGPRPRLLENPYYIRSLAQT